MSEKHLGPGSVEPPRVQGTLLRLYSMVFCPFAKRVRLVTKIKNIPHDIVNINLMNKPEWYLAIHPKGQVPSILDGDKIVNESLDIVDYLDEKYPTDEPLYPKDPAEKLKDKEVIRTLVGNATGAFSSFLYSRTEDNQNSTAEKAIEILLPSVQPLENELIHRKSPFFGGQKPGMIDYMLWPWAETIPLLSAKVGVRKLPLKDDQIPVLRKWVRQMAEVPVIKKLFVPPEVLVEVAEAMKSNTLNYDAIGQVSALLNFDKIIIEILRLVDREIYEKSAITCRSCGEENGPRSHLDHIRPVLEILLPGVQLLEEELGRPTYELTMCCGGTHRYFAAAIEGGKDSFERPPNSEIEKMGKGNDLCTSD